MFKLTLAFAMLMLVVGASSAQADDSGHVSINSLSAQLPRSNDPLAPVSDGWSSPNQVICTYGRGGLRTGCTWNPWIPQPSN
jgi:hypothetical protein